MFRQVCWIVACLLCLTACASAPPVAPPPSAMAWHDEGFAYDPSLVSVSKEDLFRLDPELALKLSDPALRRLSTAKRLDRLLAMLYGQDMRRFNYSGGHSTVASETWRRKSGDCLSLTVLAYAMARAMNMNAQMQEVPIPAVFDRRDQMDFLSQHVNVLFRHAGPLELTNGAMQSRDMIVDFEPEFGSRRVGETLSDEAVLARFYNNLAAEHLSKGAHVLAYAHFKAAIQADPSYAASYGNLALLYRGKGLVVEAEQMLRHAVTLSKQSYVPMNALHQLLQEQGRHDEAKAFATLLQTKRDTDPYYWIGLGLKHYQDGQFQQSIRALERAQSLTSGFEEVHRYLALAYWRAGDAGHANEQLALLRTLQPGGTEVARLRKKFETRQPP